MIPERKPTHSVEVLLEDVIKPLGITIIEAAQTLGLSQKTLSELVNKKSALSPEMALRIAEATNTRPESWLMECITEKTGRPIRILSSTCRLNVCKNLGRQQTGEFNM